MMRYSKQREAIWNYLKERIDHPTADQIYENVRKTQPNISLGTVYRNLMQLRDIGRLRTVEVGDGLIHFDPNPSMHDHFICTECGRVDDIEVSDPEKIKQEASNRFPGRIDGYSAYFYGTCEECMTHKRMRASTNL